MKWFLLIIVLVLLIIFAISGVYGARYITKEICEEKESISFTDEILGLG